MIMNLYGNTRKFNEMGYELRLGYFKLGIWGFINVGYWICVEIP